MLRAFQTEPTGEQEGELIDILPSRSQKSKVSSSNEEATRKRSNSKGKSKGSSTATAISQSATAANKSNKTVPAMTTPVAPMPTT
jgi:hypothetical protein